MLSHHHIKLALMPLEGEGRVGVKRVNAIFSSHILGCLVRGVK